MGTVHNRTDVFYTHVYRVAYLMKPRPYSIHDVTSRIDKEALVVAVYVGGYGAIHFSHPDPPPSSSHSTLSISTQAAPPLTANHEGRTYYKEQIWTDTDDFPAFIGSSSLCFIVTASKDFYLFRQTTICKVGPREVSILRPSTTTAAGQKEVARPRLGKGSYSSPLLSSGQSHSAE